MSLSHRLRPPSITLVYHLRQTVSGGRCARYGLTFRDLQAPPAGTACRAQVDVHSSWPTYVEYAVFILHPASTSSTWCPCILTSASLKARTNSSHVSFSKVQERRSSDTSFGRVKTRASGWKTLVAKPTHSEDAQIATRAPLTLGDSGRDQHLALAASGQWIYQRRDARQEGLDRWFLGTSIHHNPVKKQLEIV